MPNPNGIGGFQKGHQLATGRPKGSITSLKTKLTRELLSAAEERWPELCGALIDQSLRNPNVLMFVIKSALLNSFAMEDEVFTEEQLTNADDVAKLTYPQLLEVASKIREINPNVDSLIKEMVREEKKDGV